MLTGAGYLMRLQVLAHALVSGVDRVVALVPVKEVNATQTHLDKTVAQVARLGETRATVKRGAVEHELHQRGQMELLATASQLVTQQFPATGQFFDCALRAQVACERHAIN